MKWLSCIRAASEERQFTAWKKILGEGNQWGLMRPFTRCDEFLCKEIPIRWLYALPSQFPSIAVQIIIIGIHDFIGIPSREREREEFFAGGKRQQYNKFLVILFYLCLNFENYVIQNLIILWYRKKDKEIFE